MTDQIKEKMIELREQGLGYRKIAQEVGLNVGSVTIFFRRLKEKQNTTFCKYCGRKVEQTKGHRQKIFCDEGCRRHWWCQHRESGCRKAFYTIKCKQCGKTFEVYGNPQRVYCSWECYSVHRIKNSRENQKIVDTSL